MPLVAGGVDLDFVTVVYAVPGVLGLLGESDKDSAVVFLPGRFEDHSQRSVTDFVSGEIEQPHAAFGLQHSVLYRELAGADHSPTGQILSVEELFRRSGGEGKD